MALEQHRSQLLPVIEFGSDGRLMVTNRDGTYPLRNKPKDGDGNNNRQQMNNLTVDKYALQDLDKYNIQDFGQYIGGSGSTAAAKTTMNLSIDSKKGPPKFKTRNGTATSDGGGTHSTASSSLIRRLRRVRSSRKHHSSGLDLQTSRDTYDGSLRSPSSVASSKGRRPSSAKKKKAAEHTSSSLDKPPKKFMFGRSASIDRKSKSSSWGGSVGRHSGRRSTGGGDSDGGESLGSRLRRGPPRMTPEFAATLEREKRIREATGVTSGSLSSYSNGSGGRRSVFNEQKFDGRRRRIVRDESLPSVIFIIVGSLLIVVGIVRLVISYWHEYGSPLWAGVPVCNCIYCLTGRMDGRAGGRTDGRMNGRE